MISESVRHSRRDTGARSMLGGREQVGQGVADPLRQPEVMRRAPTFLLPCDPKPRHTASADSYVAKRKQSEDRSGFRSSDGFSPGARPAKLG
jgi:hypothetical protein